MNETVKTYCDETGLVFTRCRPYRKNDQAWVEQKNGAVVRHAVGYRRYEGVEAAAALARLYAALRLFVNFFQPAIVQASRKGPRRRQGQEELPRAGDAVSAAVGESAHLRKGAAPGRHQRAQPLAADSVPARR
jgi:hypothetical protein